MKIKTITKIVIWTASALFFLIVVLAVHIWWAYHPKVDGSTKVMARIDITKPISTSDAAKISSWFYEQKAVDHVLVNPNTGIVIFTFYPIKSSGNEIVKNFKSRLHYDAYRFMPTQKDLARSCPVAGSSFYYKVYKIIDRIL